MKNALLLIFLCATLALKAQEIKKSDAINKEIRELELQNNKLVLEKYMADNKDSVRAIPIFNLGNTIVHNILKSKNNPKIDSLEQDVKILFKERDSIRKLIPEYDKFYAEYMSASAEKKKEMNYAYAQLRKKVEISHPHYVAANKKINLNRAKYCYLVLEILKDDFHSKNKILPLTFIPYQELNVYNSDFTIKENQVKIQILNNLYRKTLEEELNQKYKE
jgi:hypothetical protein